MLNECILCVFYVLMCVAAYAFSVGRSYQRDREHLHDTLTLFTFTNAQCFMEADHEAINICHWPDQIPHLSMFSGSQVRNFKLLVLRPLWTDLDETLHALWDSSGLSFDLFWWRGEEHLKAHQNHKIMTKSPQAKQHAAGTTIVFSSSEKEGNQ